MSATMPSRDHAKDSSLIFLLGLFVSLVGLTNQAFYNFQTRLAVFAQEMFYYGVHFFPTTYSVPYPDYPSTGIVLIYLASLPFGAVNQFSAVLPTALASALILMFTYRIGALHDRRWGLLGALFTLFTLTFISDARTISLDQYVALITVICFYCAHKASLNSKKQPLTVLLLLLALGFAFRGPIGLVIPTGVLCGYYIIEKQYRHFVWIALSASVLLVVSSTLLLFIAYHEGGRAFVDEVIKMQVAGRLESDSISLLTRIQESYFIESFATYALSYPIAVIVVLAYAKQLISSPSQHHLLRHLVIWTLVILVGMSLTGSHKTRYILSITPAIALIAAYLLCGPANPPKALAWIKRAFMAFCFILPPLGILSILGGWYYLIRNAPALEITLIIPALILISVSFIALCVWLKRSHNKQHQQTAVFSLAVGVFVSIHIMIVEPVYRALSPAQDFITHVETLRNENNAALGFYRISADKEAIKYIVHVNQPLTPVFISTPEALLESHTPTYFITKQREIAHLPEKVQEQISIITQGKIERLDVVVFTLS